jgi:hypothetical protein
MKRLSLELGKIPEMQKKNLIHSSFTMIHPEGILGGFNPKEIDEIIELMLQMIAQEK